MKFHRMYSVFVLCHIVFLYEFMQHFIMCKITTQDGVKGCLLPELSHSKCIIVCKSMIPGGYLQGVKEKMMPGTLENGTPMPKGIPFSKIPHEILHSIRLPPNTQFMGSKPIVLVF